MTQYKQEKYKEFAMRAKEFIAKNPTASRKRIADYAGVYTGTLERLQDQYDFKLPEPMNIKQKRKATNWNTMISSDKK